MSGHDRAADRYARLALGAGFLSAVAGRFGLWSGAAWAEAFFGTAMAISFGPKSPLDYSVFSASACALLLASRQPRSPGAAR